MFVHLQFDDINQKKSKPIQKDKRTVCGHINSASILSCLSGVSLGLSLYGGCSCFVVLVMLAL